MTFIFLGLCVVLAGTFLALDRHSLANQRRSEGLRHNGRAYWSEP